MTMHLAQGLTTIRNKKYKPKMTKANIAKWTEGLRVKNKENKRLGLPKMTFEQYVDYCHGISTEVDNRSRPSFRTMDTSNNWRAEQDRLHREKYPSMSISSKSTSGTGEDIAWQKEKEEICKNYTIAPAYNKGAYQVIGKSNIKDIGK